MKQEDYDRRRPASDWMTLKDIDGEDGPVATPVNQCPYCQSTSVSETRPIGLLKQTSFFCEECDRESLPIQPDDGY